MPVRDATPDDVPEILALVRELAGYERLEDQVVFDADEFARHLFGPDPVAHVLMAVTADGTVAGFALWFRSFSTFLGRPGIWLEDLFVRPQHRGSGFGRELLHALFARTTGRVEWAVLDWNEPAHAFYATLGSAPVDGWTTWRRPPPS